MKELIIKYMEGNFNGYADLEKVFGLPINEILSILYQEIKVFEQDFANATQTGYVFVDNKNSDKIIYTKTFISDKLVSESIVIKTKGYKILFSENILHNNNV